ncbi:hypothetical protein [Nocardioides lianchengensis]|uniref:hypothetical protein n=1 Tax=Nocardioides lianchengensis TaxID=1045774 RepID=UPI000B890DC9|nr:hypothetical protein [Nocardioides lianchengensis]NYG11000.1 hypothetical protein [Nocardioides lianchengensis]
MLGLVLIVAIVIGALAGVPAASASENPACGNLSLQDVSFDAPEMTGRTAVGGSCWTLPFVAGDVVRLADHGVDSPRWTILDAAEVTRCDLSRTDSADVAECTLGGVAPYRLAVRSSNGPNWDTSYRGHVLRLSDPLGCRDLRVTALVQEPAETDRVELGARSTACWRGTVGRPGPVAVRADDRRRVELRSADGSVICTGREEACDVTEAEVALMVTNRSYLSSVTTIASLTPLADAGEECPSVPLGWSSATFRPVESLYAVDCREVGARAGDVLFLPEESYPWKLRIAGPDGQDACGPGTAPEVCRLEGEGPYRLLSWHGTDTDWSPLRAPRLAVRSVTHHEACPVIAPTTADDPGSTSDEMGCRVLVADTPGVHVVDGGDDRERLVVDALGREVCRTGGAGCVLTGDQTYLLVTRDFDPELPVVLRRLDEVGCPPLANDPGAVWTIPAGMRSAACATLDRPGGAAVLGVQPLRAATSEYGRVLDSTGAVVCQTFTTRACVLTGPGPFYAVRDGDDAASRMSVLRLDDPTGCRPLPGGPFGSDAGADVVMPEGRFAACLAVPRDELVNETIFAFERRDGVGTASLEVRDAFPGACKTEGKAGVTGTAYCRISEPASPSTTVVVKGDGQAGSWRVVRRPRGGDASCLSADLTPAGGPAAVGRLASYVALDCWRVAATAEDRVVFDLHGLDEDVATLITGNAGQACGDNGFELCAMTGQTAYHVVVRDRGFQSTTADYELAAFSAERNGVPSPSCVTVPDEGTDISAVLSAGRTALCLRLPKRDFRLQLSPGVQVHGVERLFGNHWGGTSCTWVESSNWDCAHDGWMPEGAPSRSILVTRSDGPSRVEVEASLACQHGTCPQESLVADVLPSISGVARPGAVLDANPGIWSPAATSYEIRWMIGSELIGVGRTLTVLPEHVGGQIRLQVTASAGKLSATAFSESVTVQESAEPPRFVVPPRLSGTGRVGTVLRASPGTWQPTPDAIAYTWLADGRPVRGQHGVTLSIGPALLGRRIAVEVTATDPRGSRTVRSANALLVRPGAAPSVVRRPRLSGTPKVGRVVRVVPGTWSTRPGRIDYLWKVGGRTLAGTGPRLRLTRALVGARVSVSIVARTPGYDDGRTSLTFRVRRR